MVKFLISGEVGNQLELFLNRVKTLAESPQHGPFHICIIAGKIDLQQVFDKNLSFPITTYFFDTMGEVTDEELSKLPNNLYYIPRMSTYVGNKNIGISTLQHNLTVGMIYSDKSKSTLSADQLTEVEDVCNSKSYKGCDILLSNEWPYDIHQFLTDADMEPLNAYCSEANESLTMMGNKEINKIVNIFRPRYHFVAGKSLFYQRCPYKNNLGPVTRFISLSHVADTKDKTKKWLHALSLDVICEMSPQHAELTTIPPNTTENPYLDINSYQAATGMKQSRSYEDDESIAKKSKLSDGASSFFFGNVNGGTLQQSPPASHLHNSFVPAGGHSSNGLTPPVVSDTNTVIPSNESNRIFVGGISRDTTDEDILSHFQSAIRVKRPNPSKAFVFVEFPSSAEANYILHNKHMFSSLHNRNLTINTANQIQPSLAAQGQQANSHQAVSEAEKSTVVFVGNIPAALNYKDEELLCLLDEAVSIKRFPSKNYVFVTFKSVQDAEKIIVSAQSTPYIFFNQKLVFGWSKTDPNSHLVSGSTGGGNAHQSNRSLTSNTLFIGNLPHEHPSLRDELKVLFPKIVSLHHPAGKDYAFLEFATNAEANAVFQESVKDKSNYCLTWEEKEYPISVGWAQGKPPSSLQRVSTHDSDCWFCLASPTVKVHLVISIGTHIYIAMPKGAITDQHVMIIPIECIPSKIHLSAEAKIEFNRFETSLFKMFQANQLIPVIYERAIRTRGRDHMQQQMIPLPATQEIVNNSYNSIMRLAKQYDLMFHEITDNKPVDEFVLTMEGGPYQEYFYISIPNDTSCNSFRRFVYVHTGANRDRQFPMFIGNELAAMILKKPERANWRNCAVSEAEESKLVEGFRGLYEPFDFTLTEE